MGIFPGSWRKLAFERDEVSVLTRSGVALHGKIAKSTLVFPCLIAIHINEGDNSRWISRILFEDAVGKGEFRGFAHPPEIFLTTEILQNTGESRLAIRSEYGGSGVVECKRIVLAEMEPSALMA